jgi:hypothetical protein
MDPGVRRKFTIFVMLAYLSLVPCGLEVYLQHENRTLASIVVGIVALLCIAATWSYVHRSGLLAEIRRRRK